MLGIGDLDERVLSVLGGEEGRNVGCSIKKALRDHEIRDFENLMQVLCGVDICGEDGERV